MIIINMIIITTSVPVMYALLASLCAPHGNHGIFCA